MSPPADIAIACHSTIVGAVGFLINAALILIILSNKDSRRKDYLTFILNRTWIDLFYSLSLAIFQPMGILETAAPLVCRVAGFQDVMFACASVAAEPMLACNRFVSLYHKNVYETVYRKWKIRIMCLGVWLLGVCSALPHVFYDSLGRAPGVICAVRFETDTLVVTLVSNYILVCLSLTLVAFFNFKIFQFVRRHQKRTLNTIQRTTLQNDGEMAKFILVSALVPLVLQTPATIGLFVRMCCRDKITDWTMFFVTAIFLVCPLLNPIITVLMVRPVRREFLKHYSRWLGKQTMVSHLNPINQPSSVTGHGPNVVRHQ